MNEENIAVGNWVSFYWNGTIVISDVRYVDKDKNYPFKLHIKTTIAGVPEDAVLEIRK